jgi:hypothetical protein
MRAKTYLVTTRASSATKERGPSRSTPPRPWSADRLGEAPARRQERPPFCVDDAKLREKRFIVHATRSASGDVVLEGFVDPRQISWITVERSIGPGAFKLHAARRGAPVRHTCMRTIRLNPRP